MGAEKTGDISRRDFIKRVGMLGFAGGMGINIMIPGRAYATKKKLNILQWAHTDSKFDWWFSKFCEAWGKQNKTEVNVEFTSE